MTSHVVECTLAPRRPVANEKPSPQGTISAGRVPRIARLMALALRFEHLVQSGTIRHYAELAQLGQVSRARLTQGLSTMLIHRRCESVTGIMRSSTTKVTSCGVFADTPKTATSSS